MADFRHYCASCALRAECEHTFGAYYADKSENGTGCNHLIHPFDLERVKRCAAAVRPADVLTKAIVETRIDDKKPSKADILERLKRMRRS